MNAGERREPFRNLTNPISFTRPASGIPHGGVGLTMLYTFGDFELDEDKRELRLRHREIPLQPRVFDLLVYLIRDRERVVSKDELLEALWPDVIVADGALQRAVSLARSALQQGGAQAAIRTFSRHGYRFCAEIQCAEPSAATLAQAELREARTAYGLGDWEAAVEAFRTADETHELSSADLERWADAAQCAGREPDAIAPLERAVAAHAVMGDRRGEARAVLLLTKIQAEQREVAVARGWFKRATRLLAGDEGTREYGLLRYLACRFAAAEGDLESAVTHGEAAVNLGRSLDDPDVEALGLVYLGLARLARGEAAEGLALQDEAAAAALAGRVSPWVAGTVYCGIIWGCRNRADWQRAAQWTEQFSRWSERSRVIEYPGLCRLHRAELLHVRGELEEAEQEVRQAIDLLSVSAPWAEGDAYRVFGDIRLTCGDLEGAETAFRRAYELGWEAQPGYALLHLARGDSAAAVRSLERALEDRRWASGQRRGLLLAHLAIAAASGEEPDRAREALAELDSRLEGYSTPALDAIVAHARGELALLEDESVEGIASLRHSLRIWQDLGAPLKAATLRLRLTELLLAGGDVEGAGLEISAAEAVFRKVPGLLQSCTTLRRDLNL
jgi:DNA-binding winged helix-turn-helix (wHTH) protein